jgi:molybdopterin adenylyltransferase
MDQERIRFAVLTASDAGAEGRRTDESGLVIERMVRELGTVGQYALLPDDTELIRDQLVAWADSGKVDVILTSGGTGFSPRDNTPEATLAAIERQVPGIPEAMRAKSLEHTDRAMLSRAVAGIRGCTLIVNLPGSPKGVQECLEVFLPVLPHAVEILTGRGGECARK